MIPQIILEEIEWLKELGQYKKALNLVNKYLIKNPHNREALYQVADIEYRLGKFSKSEKPIDYLISSNPKDEMWWYLKWVLCMEKTEREAAKKYFKQCFKLLDEQSNPEIMRCLALSEYWSWEKEIWLSLLSRAFHENDRDAEIILNLVELYILEWKLTQARKYIEHFYYKRKEIMFFDKDELYYDTKLSIFDEYIINMMW